MDTDVLHNIMRNYKAIITVEDGVIKGGFGSSITAFATSHGYTLKITSLGIPDAFIEHGNISRLQQSCGIDVKSLTDIFSAY